VSTEQKNVTERRISHPLIHNIFNANAHILSYLPWKSFQEGLPSCLLYPQLNFVHQQYFSFSTEFPSKASVWSYTVFASLLYCFQAYKKAHIPSINSSVLILFLNGKVIYSLLSFVPLKRLSWGHHAHQRLRFSAIVRAPH